MTSSPARKSDRRVDNELAYVLHAMPYRETSLLVQVFSRQHGRVALIAKGAKRRGSALRSALVYFAPLSLNWSGLGEVKTLTRVEWAGGLPPVPGKHLLSAYYLNELILRLLAREDAHPRVFEAYESTIADLASDSSAVGEGLRRFEWQLLKDIGYAPALDHTHKGEAVRPEVRYRVDPVSGVFPADTAKGEQGILGAHLLSIQRGEFAEGAGQSVMKGLLRMLLNYHMDNKPLHTRQVLLALQQR